MTTTLVTEKEDDRPTSRSLPSLALPERFRLSGMALATVGFLLLGFVAQFAGISQISYARDQQLSYDDFRFQLANATAPVGQTGQDDHLLPIGTPIAVLSAPSIGLRSVVEEGTSSGVTQAGPGHRRDTPFPGQSGASVVYGRQSTYGAPFGRIGDLNPGDTITATTGQGVSKYIVTDVRYTGDPLPAGLTAGEGRLTLVSAAGLPFVPSTIVRVDAKLATAAQVRPTQVFNYAALSDTELTMAGDPSVWPLLVLALAALFGVLALMSLSRRYWGKWQTWIVAVPVLFAIGCFAAVQVAVLLPNVI